MDEVMNVCLPALAVTAVPVLAGRLVRRRLARRGRLIALAALLLVCAGIGVWGCLETSAGVPSGQAVTAGLVAGIGLGLLPLGVFYAIGYGVRSAPAAVIAWFVASLPVACYAFVVLFGLIATQDCSPGQYECPV
jgi:hypothetical protein